MKKIIFIFQDGPAGTTEVKMQIHGKDGEVYENCLSYTNIEIIGSRDPRHIINRIFSEAAVRFVDFLLLKQAEGMK